jgi:RNA polymerase sigma-70 factor, ECF subfamily
MGCVKFPPGFLPYFAGGNRTMQGAKSSPEHLLERARSGDTEAFGQLLAHYHNYMRLLARALAGAALKLRLDASDVVQEACLDAHRDFPRFEGSTEAELLAWLRRILARNLADLARYETALMRDHRRQKSLESLLEQSSLSVQEALAATAATPSAVAAQRERAVFLADALEGLPEDYRDVVILRNLEGLKFSEVAARMGRSSGAVRMLWARAIERLSEALEGLS